MRSHLKLLGGLLVSVWSSGMAPAAVPNPPPIVVSHADTPPLDEDTLLKIYLGKVIEVNGRPVIPVNLAKGNNLRKDFMERILAQDDDKFVAYWTVRRYIGKGSPPREFTSVEEQLEYIRTTPGAIGYADAGAHVAPGLKTLMKKP